RVDTGGVMMKFDSVYVGAGNLTDVTRHFTLGLQGLQPLPRSVVVRGYACDAATARNCSVTNSTTLIPVPPVKCGSVAPLGGRPRRRAPPRVAPGPARLPDRNVSRVDGAAA